MKGERANLLRLDTSRLILRVPEPEDAPAMTRFVVENRDYLAPWDPVRSDEYFTEEYWRRALADGVGDFQAGRSLPLAVWLRNASPPGIIGRCNFSAIIRGAFHAAYLGVALAESCQGRGYMTEALRASIDYCFTELNLHRIMANYMPSNVRSEALLERLGFVREGFARDYLHLNGRWQDHVMTALVNSRWKAAGAHTHKKSAPDTRRTL